MKKIIAALAVFALSVAVFAQDYDDSSDSEYDDYSYDSSSSSSVTVNGEAGVKGRAWYGYYDDGGNWSNGFDGKDDIKNAEMQGSAYGKLDVEYVGDISDVNVKFKVDSATVKDNPEDILEEATMRGYFGNWVISGGKMKVVWGKGDKLHVLDNFNANDYTDFIFPEYIDRRIAEPMFSVAYSVPNASNIRFEGIVTPIMTADRFASSGVLIPAAQVNLTNTVQNIVVNNTLSTLNNGGLTPSDSKITVSPSAFSAIASASSFSSDDLYENNIKSLKYAQAGARMTGTLGSVDWGFSYYYGHYKQPSANLENYITSLVTAAAAAHQTEVAATAAELIKTGYDAETAKTIAAKRVGSQYASTVAHDGTQALALPSLDYDRLQTFGFEIAAVIWKFNMRGEAAYNLTEDIDGDNPWVKNNSIAWVGGFDIDLPIHNVNFNIQETGTYTLHSDKIKDGDYSSYDVDYNSDDNYCINKIVLNISDKWLHDKLDTECTLIYGIENKEWCVQPKIEYNPSEGLFLTLSGAYLYSDNENGEFYNFTADSASDHKKCFGQIAVKYAF